jgi:sugar O-acyltransferase (sialic acid O-acetyltransferase NeuD family)
MIIVGAGGHAKELLGIVKLLQDTDGIFFYDDVTINLPEKLFNQFAVLRNETDAREKLLLDPRFVLGVGNPIVRFKLAQKMISYGGILTSLISPNTTIGTFNVNLGIGLNIMSGAVITEEISIGRGSLIHTHVSVHHDSSIGEFCELLPGSHILGNVKIGNYTSIGSGAIVLPKLTIGDNVIVGAGAVVTKNIESGLTVKGVPAR